MSNLDQTITKIQEIIEAHKDSRQKLSLIPTLLQDALKGSQDIPVEADVQEGSILAPGKKPKKLYEAAFLALEQEGGEARVKDLAPKVSKILRRKVEPQNVYVALEYAKKHLGGVSREKGLWRLSKKSN